MEKNYKLYHGDCLDKLKELEDNSIDSIVTDPPYGLAFMGKKWDYDVPSQQIWEECMRVLKPGGHLLAFAGSRTYHRMAVRIEDAGFDIRDQIMWVYGSGFPKSHNIGKSVDKIEGNDRKVVGEKTGGAYSSGTNNVGIKHIVKDGQDGRKTLPTRGDDFGKITKGNSPYEGWGTALKPAHEPIVMARKPFKGNVAQNVLEWGTGGINVDGCRIGNEVRKNQQKNFANNVGGVFKETNSSKDEFVEVDGRFPANFILECTCKTTHTKPAPKSGHWPKGKTKGFGEFGGGESSYEGVGPKEEGDMVIHTDPNCPCYILDKQSGKLNKQAKCKTDNKSGWQNDYVGGNGVNAVERKLYLDEGGASRFFYCPKANKSDRDEGLATQPKSIAYKARPTERQNIHPTVKPTDLMTYLIRLVTPKGGVVLDPFMGSGSTGKSAMREGFQFVGIEKEEEYIQIAEQRIEWEYNKQNPHNWF